MGIDTGLCVSAAADSFTAANEEASTRGDHASRRSRECNGVTPLAIIRSMGAALTNFRIERRGAKRSSWFSSFPATRAGGEAATRPASFPDARS